MLSASSGRDQSKKSPATTVATAQPKQEAGARGGEHDTRRGILRPVGPRWSRKNFAAAAMRQGKLEILKTRGAEGGEGGPPPDRPPAPSKRRGGGGQREEEGESANRRPAPPAGAKRPLKQLPYEGPEGSELRCLPNPCPLSGLRRPGLAS